MNKSLAIALFIGTTGAMTASLPASADTVAVPAGQQGEKSMATPERGLNGAQVEQRYGSPSTRKAAVGDPPIIRWIYDGYTVYFENDYVIHSVRHPNR